MPYDRTVKNSRPSTLSQPVMAWAGRGVIRNRMASRSTRTGQVGLVDAQDRSPRRRQPTADSATADRAPRRAQRKEQQRSIETRRAIMKEALAEFAEKGFAAASIREIAARVGLPHATITHHYRTKDLLWQAVAEDLFATIRGLWDGVAEREAAHSTFDRLFAEYVSFLNFTLEHPLFHQFLAQEKWPGNPRLPWLAQNILAPLLEHLLPEIREAQKDGNLPPGNPILLHYIFLALMSAPAMFGAEMEFTAGVKSTNTVIVSEYMVLVRSLISRAPSPGQKALLES